MFVKISAKPVDIVIVQVCMPTSDHYEDEIEKNIYDEISEILHQEERGRVNAIDMGDFNSIVGEGIIMDSFYSCGNSSLFQVSIISLCISSYNLSPPA